MQPRIVALALVAGLALVAALGSPTATPVQRSLPWDRIAGVVLERMQLEPGERVLIIAQAGPFEPLVTALRTHLAGARAVDLGAIGVGGGAPPGWETEFTRRARGRSLDQLVETFADIDIALMLPGAQPAHRPYAAMQEVLRRGDGRTIHFHWAGAYALDGSEIVVSAGHDAVYLRALTDTDYTALAGVQRSFEEALRSGGVRVTTPEGTDLRFTIGDRPVTRQDGDASARRAAKARTLIDREIELPAGAIRVAPVETTVQGRIAFPPSQWNGQRVEGLVLAFSGGQVVDVSAETGSEAVEEEMRIAGPAARAFREFALGFNPLLAVPEPIGDPLMTLAMDPWIPYYGYGAGVVRLSLGDNSELGGNVTGGYVRWNFFTDATVSVGDTVWVREGRLVLPARSE